MKFILFVSLLSLILNSNGQMYDPALEALIPRGNAFPFGVASGDPRADQVILWTKIYPADVSISYEVKWELATDTLLNNIVASGTVISDSSSAFTIMAEPENLVAETTYFYRFTSEGAFSPVGRTRTASEDPDQLRFAVVSCANYLDRYYNGYALVANRHDLDAVIHLGDYIYEYSTAAENLNRYHIPNREIISLRDYRTRYAQYRLDPDLAEMHRLHPVIAIWDDHEFANDSYRTGAKNHSADEGDWETRKATAMQTWFEWLPTMTRHEKTIVRNFSFGNLADLFMVDGRMQRDEPIIDFKDPAVEHADRTKLGTEQTDQLTTWLSNSSARWKVLGNNVMFSAVDLGRMAKERQWNMDAWDGFPANRAQILDTLEINDIRNVVVITGDIHMAWCLELVENPHDKKGKYRKRGDGVLGAEFVVQSISSANVDEYTGRFFGWFANWYMRSKQRNPHVRYVNSNDHGYMLLELTQDAATATWFFTKKPYERTLELKKPVVWSLRYNGRLEKGAIKNRAIIITEEPDVMLQN